MARTVDTSSTFETWRQNYNTLATEVGDPAALTTANKDSIVNAINYIMDQYFFFQDFDYDGSDGASSGGSARRLFSGADNNGNTLQYMASKVLVYKDGALLRNGTDYIAVDGTSVILTSTAATTAVIRISSYTGSYTATPAGQESLFHWQTAGSNIWNRNDGGVVIQSGREAGELVTVPTVADSIQLDGATYINGTLSVTGIVTANAGVVVDNITIDGTEIDLSSGDLTIDVAGRIDLSADDNGEIRLYDGSSMYAQFKDDDDRLSIQGLLADKDMMFVINDGGVATTALRIDAADAGAATFNSTARVTGIGIGMDPTELLDIVSASGDARVRLDAPSGSDTEIKFFNAGSAQYTIGHDDGTDNFVIGGANVDSAYVTINKSGVLAATSLDISGAIDVDGTTNLDVVDIDGAVDMASTLQVTGVATFTAVPVLPANSIDSDHYVDGSIDTAHYAANSIDATAINVSGNGTSGHALVSDGDGSFSYAAFSGSNTTYSTSWVDSGSDAILRLTPSAGGADDLTIVAGSGITITPSGDNLTVAATGATPSVVTVADESSDTSCFPLFATAATGDLGPKTGSNLTFNSSSGLLTATSFAGIGSGLTDLNASEIDTGTIAAARVATLNQDTTGTAAVATVATTVTITDNESTNENNALVFVSGANNAGGNLGLECDGDINYNPSTGTLLAPNFSGTITQAAQTSITSLGTLTGLTVDDITLNGSEISDAGTLTINVGGDIHLDADGGDVALLDDGTQYGALTSTGGNLIIKSGSTTAITFAGAVATFADVPVLPANTIDSNHYVDGSIDQAHIADNQVTLAKMAGLARGKIIYGDSSGNPAALAVGSNGYVLKSDGTDISWAADAGLSTEEVQDIVGGMFTTTNTETGITATYQDGTGDIDLVIGTLNQNTTGNAATATALATARTIGGVSFDGTGNINLPGVNASGTQDTSGNAATATTAGTVTTAAQSAITSLGTLTTLTVDNVIINGTTIGHTGDTDLMTLASGVLTVAGEVDAVSLDISGNADIDGTLETDNLTIGGSQGSDGQVLTSTGSGVAWESASGAVSAIANFSDNRVITASSSTALNGEANMTFNGSTLAVAGAITATGDVTAFLSSDVAFKENLINIPNPLEKISMISGYMFDWKDHKDPLVIGKGHDVGIIAQEVEKVLPEVVVTRDNGKKAVNYQKIIPLLIESIKELKDEVEFLKNSKS